MAAEMKTLILLSTLLCCVLSMSIERKMDDTESFATHGFKRSTCKNSCWGDFERCVRAGKTLADHLLCLEAKDVCYQDC